MANDTILETRGLTKEFKGFVAVKDVSLAVTRGTIHALGLCVVVADDSTLLVVVVVAAVLTIRNGDAAEQRECQTRN